VGKFLSPRQAVNRNAMVGNNDSNNDDSDDGDHCFLSLPPAPACASRSAYIKCDFEK
jgi:hypothetical protein